MKQRIEVLATTVPADVHYIADHLRAEDRMELETATGRTAHETVFASWAYSEHTWVALIDGVPGIVFGVGTGGVIWMVGTDAINQVTLSVFRQGRKIVQQLLDVYGRLYNRADCRNHLHLRWLKLLGFTFDDIVEVNGHPFQRFHMNKEAQDV